MISEDARMICRMRDLRTIGLTKRQFNCVMRLEQDRR